MIDGQFQVSADGQTCWIHYEDGSTIGRFSKQFGMDAHRTMTDQMKGMGQCLACTHEAPGPKDWARFREVLLAEYGVDVPFDLITFEDKA